MTAGDMLLSVQDLVVRFDTHDAASTPSTA